jgi:hypothetical protein
MQCSHRARQLCEARADEQALAQPHGDLTTFIEHTTQLGGQHAQTVLGCCEQVRVGKGLTHGYQPRGPRPRAQTAAQQSATCEQEHSKVGGPTSISMRTEQPPRCTGKESVTWQMCSTVVQHLRCDLAVRGPERVEQLLTHDDELTQCVAEWLQQQRVVADVDPLVREVRAALRCV